MDNILQSMVDGEYVIQPDIAVARDGGTICFVAINSAGDKQTIYLDRRIRTETRDSFYKDEYPGNSGSVLLGNSDELVGKIETALKDGLDKQQS